MPGSRGSPGLQRPPRGRCATGGPLNMRVALLGCRAGVAARLPLELADAVVSYGAEASVCTAAGDALRDGYSHLLVLQGDAELVKDFPALWGPVTRALRRAPAIDYVLLGGEHYGPLFWGTGTNATGGTPTVHPAAPVITRCSWSTGGYAFVARYDRLRRLARGEVAWLPPSAALVPSVAYRRHAAAMPMALLMSLTRGKGAEGADGGQRDAQRWLETHWQRLLQGLLAYAAFTQLATAAKRRLHAVAA
jgi:hypothetical protein